MKWAAVVCLVLVVAGLLACSRRQGAEPACYHAVDQNGGDHTSTSVPILGPDYFLYWEREDAWGVIFSPAGYWVDKECLRARGVE